MSRFRNEIGVLAALAAAFLWALAAILFYDLGAKLSPAVLNLYKNVVAMGFLLAGGVLLRRVRKPIARKDWALLLLSGVIGIGIGDCAFFRCLNELGERQTVLLSESLAPLAVFIIAAFSLRESPSLANLGGMLLILIGVGWVTLERPDDVELGRITQSGVFYGILAAVCQATGLVLSRAALRRQAVDSLWSTLIRLLGGTLFLLVWIPLSGQSIINTSLWSTSIVGWIVVASLVGPCVGIWLQQVSVMHTKAAITQTLIATSPLFVLPMVWLRGEAITLGAVLGALLAACGVGVLAYFAQPDSDKAEVSAAGGGEDGGGED